MSDTKILIAAHKPYYFPEDKAYLPVQVGAKGKDRFLPIADDEGDNISEKNPRYCELTALYFAWKNLTADAVGLVHYRRYFKGNFKFSVNGRKIGVLSKEDCEGILRGTDVILPKKRRYYIETLYSHYAHTLYVEPLDITGEIIRETCGGYYAEFLRLKKRRSAHMFNMMIMKKSVLDNYCGWLFPILLELERRVDASKYDAFHARFFGRISELLLDVYVNVNGIAYKEIKVVSTENINWAKKIGDFLLAKFTHKKYGKSF
ncbi:MAG: DUF4422 domain-containing protein [Clostridia bacterium]|nr:DUF4422 domain-containing protein [Clostridia bacterium]